MRSFLNNIPFSLAKVEGLPTFANYNDSYLFLLEETTRKVYSVFFLDDNGGKKDFSSLVFTVIEPPQAGLRVASFTAFHSSVDDHAYDNTGLTVVYENDMVSKYLPLSETYPNFLNTSGVKAPMDFTFNFLDGGVYSEYETYLPRTLVVPPDIMYDSSSKYINNIPLSYPMYTMKTNEPFSSLEMFIKDTATSYNDSNYTSNTYSDIAFNLGLGKTLLIKNNGEMLYASYLENKINSWRLGGSETPIKVKGIKLINEVIIHLTVQSGNNFVYKFNPSVDLNPILLFRLTSGINADLSDKITYSRYFSPTNNNYVRYMAVLTVNNGNVEIRTTESLGISKIEYASDMNETSYPYFDDHLYIRDMVVNSSSNRTFTIVPNLSAHPSIDSTLKNNILIAIFKKIMELTVIDYINKNVESDPFYVITRTLDPTYESENMKTARACGRKIKGVLNSSQLQLELFNMDYDNSLTKTVPTGVTIVLDNFIPPPDAEAFGFSGSNFYYEYDTPQYEILIKDVNLVLDKIVEVANSRTLNVSLSYYDASTGTLKDWGSANVQISETN